MFLSQRANDLPLRQASAPCTCKAWQLHRAWTKAHWVAECKFGTLPLSLTLEMLLHMFQKNKRCQLPMTPLQRKSKILRNAALPYIFYPSRPRLAFWVKIPRRTGQRLCRRQVQWKLWRLGERWGEGFFSSKRSLGTVVSLTSQRNKCFFFAFDRELSRRSLPLGLQRGVVRCLPYLKILMVMVALD